MIIKFVVVNESRFVCSIAIAWIVMHILLLRGCLYLCILFGHLYTSVVCLSLKQSENIFHKPRLVLSDVSVGGTSIHIKKST